MTKQMQRQIIQWDVTNWSRALQYWEASINWESIETCLELGGRAGGLSLWLALKGKHVVCSDIENSGMIASQLHNRYRFCHPVFYKDIDATNIPFENNFDLIIFKSILGVVGVNNNACRQKQAIEQIHKALKPGGKLLFAENLCGSRIHKLLRKQFVKWGNSWRYVSLQELSTYLNTFKKYTLKATGFSGLLGRNEMQREFLGALDQKIFDTLVPDSWKYIGYGIAEK